MKRKYFFNYSFLFAVLITLLVGCKPEKYAIPITKDALQNDVIKRGLGPNIVGDTISFAYAMALPQSRGKLVSAEVEASIAGAAKTMLENKSYYTLGTGADTGIVVGQPSVNSGNKTTVTFVRDTFAATLRYYYIVPEEARDKSVSFTFSAQSNNGEKVSYKMGPYKVAKMDLVRNITVKNADSCFISIADLKVYNAAGAATNAAKIDLVYLYRTFANSAFNHALVSPAADTQYLPSVTLPTGVNRSTKLRKVFNLQDYNLAYTNFGIYIDDLDFQQLNLSDAPNFAINLKAESGVWVETADGKYRAYIYINSVNNTNRSALISIKRYAL